MFQRLFYLWIDYRLQHISAVVTKCVLGVVLVSIPAAPVVVRHNPIHHKPSHSKVVVVTNKPPVKASPSAAPKKTPPPKPSTSTSTPVVAASPAPPVQTPKAVPVPITQPTPGSGAKKLAPAPAATPPADTGTTSDPTSSSTPTTSSPTDTSTPSTPAPDYASGGYTSTNWSGYVATAGNYKHISGSWIAPSATGNGSSTTADSTWIGIGGVFSDDLIQTGTMNAVSASGQVSSAAFYELLPDSALEIQSITVSPGDSMTASIDEISAGTWTINISDATSGQIFTTTVSYASSYSTAEWIEEDPSYASGGLVPFDNFSPAKFFSGKVAGSSGVQSTLYAAHAAPITLVDQTGNALARPTTLSSDGGGFTVYRQ